MVGRLMLAAIFMASAFGKITNFEATARFMDAHGIPFSPLLCALAAMLEALGGVSLLLGYRAQWSSAALAGYLAAVTAVFHAGPDQRIDLLKNLAILGGLLQVLAFGCGEISLDGRRRSSR